MRHRDRGGRRDRKKSGQSLGRCARLFAHAIQGRVRPFRLHAARERRAADFWLHPKGSRTTPEEAAQALEALSLEGC